MKQKTKKRTKHVAPVIGTESMRRYLDHIYRARVARLSLTKRGMTVTELAKAAGLQRMTVLRFCALTKITTKEPRLSTAVRIFEALGLKFKITHG